MTRPSAVHFYVQPRASKTEVVGRHGDAIKIRVKAPPVDGAANEELIRFLAKRLKVPRRSIELVSGSSSRHKQIAIEGVPPTEMVESLLGDR
ncbi:MAG: YggU family protein [Gemmatimonadetes bacterium]|nr:YggU family protein [Gemmatimonadota bacterium]